MHDSNITTNYTITIQVFNKLINVQDVKSELELDTLQFKHGDVPFFYAVNQKVNTS